jgi:cytochrome c-type biogenesis protein
VNDVSFALAFFAGMLSFLSPCVLPLVPAYASLISGLSFEELQHKKRFLSGLGSTITFVLGFSAVFIAMGTSSSLLGSLFFKYQEYLRIGGGIIIIVFGLFISGIINPGFLMRERRFNFGNHPVGYLGSFFIGMGFAAGWTPCIGPILGTILIYAGAHASASYGSALLAVYSLGFAVPFVLSTLAINMFLAVTRRLQRFIRVFLFISGLVLIGFGIILLSNNMGWLSGFSPNIDINL